MKLRLLLCAAIVLLNSCAKENKVIVEGGNYIATMSSTVDGDKTAYKGVAADGIALLKVNVKIENYGLDLLEASLPEGYGTLSDNMGEIGSGSLTMVAPVVVGNVCSFYYHAPAAFPAAAVDSVAKANISMTLTIQRQAVSVSIPVEVVRPPIVLAHGINSGAVTYQPMIDYIRPTNKYIHQALFALDYSSTSMASYTTNIQVVPDAIDHVKATMAGRGYQTSLVNVVGHSMGGILSRIYLQSPDYRKDIMRLVCIDTPHSGTPVANLAIELAGRFPEIFGLLNTMGSIVDLQVDSPATLSLNGSQINAHKVPTHCLTATLNVEKPLSDLIAEKQYIEAILVYLVDALADNVYGEPNDLLVGLSSQQAGIQTNTLYDGEWHCSVHTTEKAALRITELCNTPLVNTELLSTAGFVPPKLEYVSVLPNINVIQAPESAITRTGAKISFKPAEKLTALLMIITDNTTGKIVTVDISLTPNLPFTIDKNLTGVTVTFVGKTENAKEIVVGKKSI